MINIYGTIGPACANPEILKGMFREGMTGMRLNTSHMSVKEAAPQIRMIREAACCKWSRSADFDRYARTGTAHSKDGATDDIRSESANLFSGRNM